MVILDFDAQRLSCDDLPALANRTDLTLSESEPFVYKDNNLQVRAIWHEKQVHANDWMYFTWTSSCPKDGDPIAVTNADAWSPGFVGYEFNQFAAIEYLDLVRTDGLAKENL